MSRFTPVFIASLLSAMPTIAAAEDAKTADADAVALIENRADDESVYEFSYAAPGSPVLPLIGVAGDQITRSESLRKFGFAVLGGLSGKSPGQGLAIDFTPYWLLSRQAMSLHEYRQGNNLLGRIAARTKVGLAFGLGDKASARPSSYVASVSTSLLDAQDQLYSDNFDKCVLGSPIEQAFDSIHNQIAAEMVAEINANKDKPNKDKPEPDWVARQTALYEKYETDNPGLIDRTYSECATRLSKVLAARPALDIGFGYRWRGTPGDFGQLTSSGSVLWGTFVTGVIGGRDEKAVRPGPLAGLRLRGVVHARYTIKDDVLDEKFVLKGRRDSTMIVAGIESAPALDPKKTEPLRWTLQAGWNRQTAVLLTDVDKNYWRYQAVVSVRLRDGLWLNGTLGRVSGRGVIADTQTLLSLTFTQPGKPSQLTEYYNSRGK
jgi:hypothetical protein